MGTNSYLQRSHGLALALTIAALHWPVLGLAASANDLFDLSIEELVNLEVTSVSHKAERLVDTTSAVFVITQDDIQRHGIRSIPDALRLAPGLSVLQIDANKWAIGSRGFTGRFSNKLLVLMDGRLLYTPSFSGVFWDVQDTLIEEVDRIEVIRGPGATVWGTNAVNGVINIITRRSDGVPGGVVVGGLDPEGARFAALRYASKVSERASYRAFLKYQEADGNQLLDGSPADDDWDLLRASVRTDISLNRLDLSVTAEGYSGNMGLTQQVFSPLPPYESQVADVVAVEGGFLLAQWTLPHSGSARSSGQMSIDFTDRVSSLYSEQRMTYNVDARHQRSFGRHELIVGGGLRLNAFDLVGSDNVSFIQSIDENYVASAFVQDDIALIDEILGLTLGIKLESNDLSPKDVEVMPTARLLWKSSATQTVWAAVTRAVRTPSIADLDTMVRDVAMPLPPGNPNNPFPAPLRQGTVSDPDFQSEVNVAIEAGIRGQVTTAVGYDLAVYAMEFDRLRVVVPGDTVCNPSGISVTADPLCFLTSDSVIAQLQFSNAADGYVRGGELSLDWLIHDRWRVRSALSYANERLEAQPLSIGTAPTAPKWQAIIRSEWTPTDTLSIAALVRYVDEIPYWAIDDYWQANLHVRWQYGDAWVLSAGVRNLLDDATEEYRSEFGDVVTTEIERSAFLNLRYAF